MLKREVKMSFENMSVSDSSAAVLERKTIKLQVLLLLRCITAAKSKKFCSSSFLLHSPLFCTSLFPLLILIPF